MVTSYDFRGVGLQWAVVGGVVGRLVILLARQDGAVSAALWAAPTSLEHGEHV